MVDERTEALKRVPAAAHTEIAALCNAAWPDEACGLVIDGAVLPSANVASGPREQRFRLGGPQALAMERALRSGADVVLWHSHTVASAGSDLSADDIAAAAPFGEPLHRTLIHMVVDARSGRARGWRAFAWDRAAFVRLT